MSQLNSTEFISDSESPPINDGEHIEAGKLSNWTSVPAIAHISEADRQVLEIHIEQLVEDLVDQAFNIILTESVSSSADEQPQSKSEALMLQSSASLAYPLALPASDQASDLVVYVPQTTSKAPTNLDPTPSSSLNTAASQLSHLQQQSWQDRLLLGSGILATFVILLGTWLNQMHWLPMRRSPIPAVNLNAQGADPFLVYLQQALKQVNTQSTLSRAQKTAIANASEPPAKPVATPVQSVTQAVQPIPKKVEAPIAAPPAAIVAPPKSPTVAIPPVATLPAPPPMGELTLSVPSLSPAGTAGLLPPPPSTNAEQPLQPPGLPNLPYTPPLTVVAPAKMVNPPAANRPARTLTGVMQMGDQSLALIEVNGVTRRIRLGETISADGAILMQVGEQEAIVQKGQEQLTIQVGQRF